MWSALLTWTVGDVCQIAFAWGIGSDAQCGNPKMVNNLSPMVRRTLDQVLPWCCWRYAYDHVPALGH